MMTPAGMTGLEAPGLPSRPLHHLPAANRTSLPPLLNPLPRQHTALCSLAVCALHALCAPLISHIAQGSSTRQHQLYKGKGPRRSNKIKALVLRRPGGAQPSS